MSNEMPVSSGREFANSPDEELLQLILSHENEISDPEVESFVSAVSDRMAKDESFAINVAENIPLTESFWIIRPLLASCLMYESSLTILTQRVKQPLFHYTEVMQCATRMSLVFRGGTKNVTKNPFGLLTDRQRKLVPYYNEHAQEDPYDLHPWKWNRMYAEGAEKAFNALEKYRTELRGVLEASIVRLKKSHVHNESVLRTIFRTEEDYNSVITSILRIIARSISISCRGNVESFIQKGEMHSCIDEAHEKNKAFLQDHLDNNHFIQKNTENFVEYYIASRKSGFINKILFTLEQHRSMEWNMEMIFAFVRGTLAAVVQNDIPHYEELYRELDEIRQQDDNAVELYVGRDGVFMWSGRRSELLSRMRNEKNERKDLKQLKVKYIVYPTAFTQKGDNPPQKNLRQSYVSANGFVSGESPYIMDTGYMGTVPLDILSISGFEPVAYSVDGRDQSRVLLLRSENKGNMYQARYVEQISRVEADEIEHRGKDVMSVEDLRLRNGRFEVTAAPSTPTEQMEFSLAKHFINRYFWNKAKHAV